MIRMIAASVCACHRASIKKTEPSHKAVPMMITRLAIFSMSLIPFGYFQEEDRHKTCPYGLAVSLSLRVAAQGRAFPVRPALLHSLDGRGRGIRRARQRRMFAKSATVSARG